MGWELRECCKGLYLLHFPNVACLLEGIKKVFSTLVVLTHEKNTMKGKRNREKREQKGLPQVKRGRDRASKKRKKSSESRSKRRRNERRKERGREKRTVVETTFTGETTETR